MARVTHVKAAQQRYKTVPVIDPETGVQKVTPVFRRNGERKKSKSGREVVRRITVDDKTQPLPNRKCDKCGKEIEVGQPYKWIAPKSGPYGGSKRFRCGKCPSWQIWDYSFSLGARIALAQHNFETRFSVDDATGVDEVRDALSSLAEEVREIATEKEEGADNIESGFGHETSQSQELRDVADQLNSWADEIEQADIPDAPEPEEHDPQPVEIFEEDEDGNQSNCEECGVECTYNDGSWSHDDDVPVTEQQLDEWHTEVEDAVSSVVDNCPV